MNKAMVVDDSKAIRMILTKALSEIGYEVEQAADGQKALAIVERDPGAISLILVDWNMPEMNGLEFVKRLRADPRCASTTLVMVTTETQVEQMALALDAGANEYVMKPFSREIIEDKLRLLGLVQ